MTHPKPEPDDIPPANETPATPQDAPESSPKEQPTAAAGDTSSDDSDKNALEHDGAAESADNEANSAKTEPPTTADKDDEPREIRAFKRVWYRIPRWVRSTAMALAVAVAGILIGSQVAGSETYEVGPLDVRMQLIPSTHGKSTVEIPPLGSLAFDSHDGPIRMEAQVEQLDEKKTREIVENPDSIDEQGPKAAEQMTDAIIDLAKRAAVAGVVAALLLGLLLFRSLGRTLLTGAMALVIIASSFSFVWFTRHPENLREPQYTGLLSNAPAVIGNAQDINEKFSEYQGSMVQLLKNFSQVYTNLSTLPSSYQPDPNTVRVLHVTDLHLNPVSFDAIKSVADQFKVDVIVDTGDITDWGTDLENRYADGISKLNKPYLFVRGNHDQQATADAVAAQPNATVLENNVVEVAGLRFAGIGDPRYTPDKSEGDLHAEVGGVLESADKLKDTIRTYDRSNPKPVDVAMIHDPAGAPTLKDSVPLVLSGHQHQRSERKLDDDTLSRVEGSTGASGLRGLYHEDGTSPLRMSVLYFSTEGELRAADEITISGPGQSTVSLNRKVYPVPETE
ncbi:MAG: metallophosphoesterase [Corynebacteriales bacterium]|nr:metallophosphoesterase [Mycobacteriales bacterium]